MSTADEVLAQMQQRIREQAAPPALDADEASRLSFWAMMKDSGGPVEPEPPELDLRMHGTGVPGHEVVLDQALGILGPLQQALSSIGQSLYKAPTSKGKIPSVVRKATQLRLAAGLSSGAVVFHLRGPAEQISDREPAGSTSAETLLELAFDELMGVLRLADTTSNSSDVAGRIRRLGPRSAKHLNDLAKSMLDHDIDITLRWRNPRLGRTAVELNRRGALGLQGAISHNRAQTTTVELRGDLVTASTVEPAAIKLPDGRLIHLQASPELARTLDRYCYRSVVALAEETVVWQLSKGTERRQYVLLSIQLAG